MPIYEYVCRACGKQSEVMHKISDPPAKKCPECGKNKLEKVVSASGFRLKGGGWYETDFKSGGKKNVAGDAAPSAAAAETKTSKPAKSETKSETKSDTKGDNKPAGKAAA